MKIGGSVMFVVTLREYLRHKVTQKVEHHHKQNTVRYHLHTLVCTLSQMYDVHKTQHNDETASSVTIKPWVSHRIALHQNQNPSIFAAVQSVHSIARSLGSCNLYRNQFGLSRINALQCE